MKILLDPGHGENTKGKASPDSRLKEYAWAREMVALIEAKLKAKGYDVSRVVTEDADVAISQRVKRINNICHTYGAKNVLLVSVHNNAAGNGGWSSARGFSVFVSKNASALSKKCAAIFTDEAVSRNLMGNRSIPQSKCWTWSWTNNDIGILHSSACPAVLTENLFMDNIDDCAYLLSYEGKEEISNLHVEAIIKYINSL